MPVSKESYYIENPYTVPQAPGYFNGYISNFRYTVGQALYRGNFTPPTTQLTTTSVGTTGPNVATTITGEVKVLLFQTLGNVIYNSANSPNITFSTGSTTSTPTSVAIPTSLTYEVDWMNSLSRVRTYTGPPEYLERITVGDLVRIDDSDTGFSANVTITAIDGTNITFDRPEGFPSDRIGGMTLTQLTTSLYKSSVEKPRSNPFVYQNVSKPQARLWYSSYVENKLLNKYFIDRSGGLPAYTETNNRLETFENPLVNGTRGDFRIPIIGQSNASPTINSYRPFQFINDEILFDSASTTPRLSSGLYYTIRTGYFAGNTQFFSNVRNITTTGRTGNLVNLMTGPGTTGDTFSIEYSGYFLPNITANYTFTINGSDDASYLWIGNNALAEYTTGNALVGTISGTASGSTELSANVYYPIRIQYGEDTGGQAFSLSFSSNVFGDTTNFRNFIYAFGNGIVSSINLNTPPSSTRTINFPLQDKITFQINSNVRIYNSLTRSKVEARVIATDRSSITVNDIDVRSIPLGASASFVESADASVYSYTESVPLLGTNATRPRDRLWWAQNFPNKFSNADKISPADPTLAIGLKTTQSNLSVFTDQVLYLYEANKPVYTVTSQTYQTSNIVADYLFDFSSNRSPFVQTFNQSISSGNVNVYFNNTDFPAAKDPFPVGSTVVLYRNTPSNIFFSSRLFTVYTATVLESTAWSVKVSFPTGWDRTWQFYKIGRPTSDVYPKVAVTPTAAPTNPRENLFYGELAQGYRFNLTRDGGLGVSVNELPNTQGNWTGNTNNWFTNLSSDPTYRRLYWLQFIRNSNQVQGLNYYIDELGTITTSGALISSSMIADVTNSSLTTAPNIFDIVNLQQFFRLDRVFLFSTTVEQYLTQLGKIYIPSPELRGDRVPIDIGLGKINRDFSPTSLIGLSENLQLHKISQFVRGIIHIAKGTTTESLFKFGQLRYLIGGKLGTYIAVGQDTRPVQIAYLTSKKQDLKSFTGGPTVNPQFNMGIVTQAPYRLASDTNRLKSYFVLFVNAMRDATRYRQAGALGRLRISSSRVADVTTAKKEPVSFWS